MAYVPTLRAPLRRYGRPMMGFGDTAINPMTGLPMTSTDTTPAPVTLPPCETAQPGQQCQSSTMNPPGLVDQLRAWIAGTTAPSTPPDPNLPSCATAQPGQACNSVTAAQAASSSQMRTVLIVGALGLGAFLLLGKKKRS